MNIVPLPFKGTCQKTEYAFLSRTKAYPSLMLHQPAQCHHFLGLRHIMVAITIAPMHGMFMLFPAILDTTVGGAEPNSSFTPPLSSACPRVVGSRWVVKASRGISFLLSSWRHAQDRDGFRSTHWGIRLFWPHENHHGVQGRTILWCPHGIPTKQIHTEWTITNL